MTEQYFFVWANTMSRVVIIPIITFFVGLAAGISIALWQSTQLNTKNIEQRKLDATTDVSQSDLPKLQANPTPIDEIRQPEMKQWIPDPGEECYLVLPEKTAVEGADSTMYLIPLDIPSLHRLAKYVGARDGTGLMGLLHQKRAVWADSSKLSVSVISVDEKTETVEIRIKSSV